MEQIGYANQGLNHRIGPQPLLKEIRFSHGLI
jgi:hypothetical protein